jgi:hypothetical protein
MPPPKDKQWKQDPTELVFPLMVLSLIVSAPIVGDAAASAAASPGAVAATATGPGDIG